MSNNEQTFPEKPEKSKKYNTGDKNCDGDAHNKSILDRVLNKYKKAINNLSKK